MNPVELVAFDYDIQEWLEGEAARPVLIKQLKRELQVLKGPRGKEFARKLSVPTAIAIAEAKLAELAKWTKQQEGGQS